MVAEALVAQASKQINRNSLTTISGGAYRVIMSKKIEEKDAFCLGVCDGIIGNNYLTKLPAAPFLSVAYLTKSVDYCCRVRLFGQKGLKMREHGAFRDDYSPNF